MAIFSMCYARMPQMSLSDANAAAVYESWKRGFLAWKLRAAQIKMWQAFRKSEGLTNVINSSRRLGKSFLMCTIAIEDAIRNPGAPIRFAAPSQKSLKKILNPLINQIISDCPAEFRPNYRSVDFMWKFPNGSEIHISGANQGHAENLRGTKALRCLIDEAGFVDDLEYLVKDVLTPQLIDTNGSLLMSSTPPPTPAHDFHQFAEEAKINGHYSEYDIYQSGYRPDVIQKFCREAGGESSTTWQREYLCKFVVDENLAITPEFRDTMVQEYPRSPLYKFYTAYEGMDTGFVDYSAILFGYYDFAAAKVVIENEAIIHGPTMTTETLATAIRQNEQSLYGEKVSSGMIRRISDNNNLILIQDLGLLHKLPFIPTTKDELPAMVNELRLLIGSGRLVVHPRCKQLIGCLKYGVWSTTKSKMVRRQFARSKVYGHFDALAALIYLVRNIDYNHNPIPVDLNVSEDTHYIAEDFRKRKEHENLRAIIGLGRR